MFKNGKLFWCITDVLFDSDIHFDFFWGGVSGKRPFIREIKSMAILMCSGLTFVINRSWVRFLSTALVKLSSYIYLQHMYVR